MLHNYNNYTNTLSRFLTGYHQLEEHNDDNDLPLSGLCEDSTPDEEPRCRSNSSATSKSFTIAAILGLNNSESGNICKYLKMAHFVWVHGIELKFLAEI